MPADAIIFYGRTKAQGLKQDHMTFPFVLKACSSIPAIREGQWIHAHALKLGCVSDLFISNTLIHLYSSCKDLESAWQVFDEMMVRDLVSWNSIICGFRKDHRFREVLDIFEAMCAEQVKADEVTMVNVISSCTHLGEWEMVETIIKYVEENCVEIDLYLGNTLIGYYGRRGFVGSAQKVFDEMKDKNIMTMNAMIAAFAKVGNLVAAKIMFDRIPRKDLVSWSSMITGYSQANHFSEALALFRQMQKDEVKADEIVMVSLLSACTHLASIDIGKSIHGYIRKNGIEMDVFLGNSLIDMYSKCGCINEAYAVFGQMVEKDAMTWNSIILGLATNGYADAALQLFSDMSRGEQRPDDTTYLGVLIACVHSGLVDEGLGYFDSMRIHGVEPQMKHYGCVVDLLGRAGELGKAFELIEKMPMKPDSVVWRALLGACKVHGNVNLAEYANKMLSGLDPCNAGNYVLLSNAYATAGRWNDAMMMRDMMVMVDLQKNPGCSLIETSRSRCSNSGAS
ncbi:hypothetical protein HPP92_022885 [Vanilla planifolia]|nr:hypothetical protein HPP92_022885 [Vanilla planifolia]